MSKQQDLPKDTQEKIARAIQAKKEIEKLPKGAPTIRNGIHWGRKT